MIIKISIGFFLPDEEGRVRFFCDVGVRIYQGSEKFTDFTARNVKQFLHQRESLPSEG